MQFVDKSVLAGTALRQSDGALIADVRIARTGVQYYLGSEVDKDNEFGFRDKAVVAVYRPGSEVFSDETMKSAAHRPVTNDHPKTETGLLDATTWKKFAVGNTADEVKGEGIYIRVPLIVSDADTIRDIQGGKREVSAGYTSELFFEDGQTEDGIHYDAVQRNIRFNHVAIVSRGRAGKTVRIGDEAALGEVPYNDGVDDERKDTMNHPLKTVTVDGIPVEVTDAGAAVIATLQARIQSMTDSSSKVLADHATALADKDKIIATKDAEIDGLRAKVLDAASLDKLVADRATLLADAALVAPKADFKGLDSKSVKALAVKTVIGDAAFAGKSEAYIDARFDTIVEDARKNGTGKHTDTFRDAMRGTGDDHTGRVVVSDEDRGKAYADMVNDMTNPKPAKVA